MEFSQPYPLLYENVPSHVKSYYPLQKRKQTPLFVLIKLSIVWRHIYVANARNKIQQQNLNILASGNAEQWERKVMF